MHNIYFSTFMVKPGGSRPRGFPAFYGSFRCNPIRPGLNEHNRSAVNDAEHGLDGAGSLRQRSAGDVLPVRRGWGSARPEDLCALPGPRGLPGVCTRQPHLPWSMGRRLRAPAATTSAQAPTRQASAADRRKNRRSRLNAARRAGATATSVPRPEPKDSASVVRCVPQSRHPASRRELSRRVPDAPPQDQSGPCTVPVRGPQF